MIRISLPDVLVTLALVAPATAAAQAPAELERAEALLAGDAVEEALTILNRWVKKRPKDAHGLFLQSTALFMSGEVERGRKALERSLELDPERRQGWLNLAAVAMSEADHRSALSHFERAEILDPQANDNDLNIGTVLLLLDRDDAARARFQRFLDRHPGDAEALYRVSSNHAVANKASGALQLLRHAISVDERMRARARRDPSYASLEAVPAFQHLLATDTFVPPPGSSRSSHVFEAPYQAGRGSMLNAVIGALQISAEPFDPQVEVTEAWALLWGRVRIKVSAADSARSRVELSAPPGRFPPPEWTQLTDRLFREITVLLHTRQKTSPGDG